MPREKLSRLLRRSARWTAVACSARSASRPGLHVRPLLAEQRLAALQLIQLDEPGLVGIKQPVFLPICVGELLV